MKPTESTLRISIGLAPRAAKNTLARQIRYRAMVVSNPLFLPKTPIRVLTKSPWIFVAEIKLHTIAIKMITSGNLNLTMIGFLRPTNTLESKKGIMVNKAIFFGQLMGSRKERLKTMVVKRIGKKNRISL